MSQSLARLSREWHSELIVYCNCTFRYKTECKIWDS